MSKPIRQRSLPAARIAKLLAPSMTDPSPQVVRGETSGGTGFAPLAQNALRAWLLVLALLLAPLAVALDVRAQLAPTAQEAAASIRRSVTVDGVEQRYTVTAGLLPIATTSNTPPRALIGYTAYTLDVPGAAARPLAIAFNGGPGASSVYLHLGGIGPRRIAARADGTIPPETPRLIDNPGSWLAFTDLVFVDPVGTGLSRVADDRPNAEQAFWGAAADADAMAAFVRTYVERHKRQAAPLALVGESYGGFRVARMGAIMQSGTVPSLLVLVSPALDIGLLRFDLTYDPVAVVARVPSMAATAWVHGRIADVGRSEADRDRFVAEAEDFAVRQLLPALLLGDALDERERDAIHERLARYLGLPRATIDRHWARVPLGAFVRELLAEANRVTGMYDASLSASSPGPGGRYQDPSFDGLFAPLETLITSYLRDEIGLAFDRRYTLLNRQVLQRWDYRGSERGFAGEATAAPHLRAALERNRALRVLIVHGRYDLVTSAFGSELALRATRLAPEARAAIRSVQLEGGHMMYLRPSEAERLREVAREAFERIGQPAP
jgi:carboxypeptidase C (cathepsin A)